MAQSYSSPLLLYPEEHVTCENYLSEKDAGFSLVTLSKNNEFRLDTNKRNYIFFIIEGKVSVNLKQLPAFNINKGEFFLVPKTEDCNIVALSNAKFIFHVFDIPINLCDRIALETLVPYCKRNVAIGKKLSIRKPLTEFVELMAYYIESGMSCKHIHEVKQKELFMILRGFYSKTENARLFEPIISKNPDFKELVLENAHVKTVEELANRCNYSLSSFNRRFHANFGESPYCWLQKQKTKSIVKRLSNKDLPLNVIIEEFGFSSASHFTIYCKRYLNMAPSDFRKRTVVERERKTKQIPGNKKTDL